jgi:predicted glutamine amidotransferase
MPNERTGVPGPTGLTKSGSMTFDVARAGQPEVGLISICNGPPAVHSAATLSATLEKLVCRWLAYHGSPILLDELLYKPKHSLIDQSLNAKLGPHTTNGDGFGVGWYGDGEEPALYKGVDPAWNDENLRELSRVIRSRLVFAHIRASTGTPVQQTNCHPFRYGKWLWMHNGLINDFEEIKRELVLGISPAFYRGIKGTSDTEVFFFLALTFGLEDDPVLAVERAVGFIEEVGQRCGIAYPMRMSVAATDGKTVWGFRYSTERRSPSLFFSTRIDALRALYPDNPVFQAVCEASRLIVSEPLSDLPGAWNEVPESTCAVIQEGEDFLQPFTPRHFDPPAITLGHPSDVLSIEPTAPWRPVYVGSDADHLRELAARCRSVAADARDPAHQAALREMSEIYETLADRTGR